MRFPQLKYSLKIPVIGLGCGVLGMSLAKLSIDLGKYAAVLLKALEYRGYDSTGAVFQGDKQQVKLLKDVGAPSTLVKTLGIENESGRIFCGQVRWATFGTVTYKNSQPHEVNCKRHLYGAHNGNITNTNELKKLLFSQGHNVVSDNDGEMLVHTVEHYFDIELGKYPNPQQENVPIRRQCMQQAIIKSADNIVGSYAAVIVDPITEYSYAIKAGSSLYFGIGSIDNNKFSLASSDLTAVLKFTKQLVNLRQGEFVEYNRNSYQIYTYKELKVKVPQGDTIIFQPGETVNRKPVLSKLRAEDTELVPPFKYFMEQEIHAEIETSGKLIKLFHNGSNTGRRMVALIQELDLYDKMKTICWQLQETDNFSVQLQIFNEFEQSNEITDFYQKVQTNYIAIYNELVKEDFEKKYFFSSNKNTFISLLNSHFNKRKLLVAKALDSVYELHDVEEFNANVNNFLDILENTWDKSRNVYLVACGTSYHASLVASMFFNDIANLEIIPILPGNFRGLYSKSLRFNDVMIGVSQSGETKDLIDIFDYVDELNKDIKKIVLVNNLNSTLGQEKSDVSIPIFCGPEIAVPATKSFINQITLFYYLAIKTGERMLKKFKDKSSNEYFNFKKDIETRFNTLDYIPRLIKETIETTEEQIEFVTSKIYQEPSMHLLATKMTGVAKEGALKIRETVLNHAEGGEASEFKHGPNTILGKNTVFGIKSIKAMLKSYNETVDNMYKKAEEKGVSPSERRDISRAIADYVFKRSYPFDLSPAAAALFEDTVRDYNFFENGYRNYPLIYITGPETKDVNLTISQINSHKIRGADTFIIAEENEDLLENARTNPHDEGYYGWGYIALPKTGDTQLTAFSATIVLQLLALRMSVRKMEKLDRLGISDHGVHPDVPKNVSKSITVD
jgi:glucosamine 6-phosphate synthetase-like amidotransferase/phosphosugar isomerase protein